MSELESFLDEQRAAAIDSSGEFTIDLRNLRRKLGRYRSDNVAFPLLKLIQSGVSANSEQVRVKLLPTGLEVRFHNPTGLARLEPEQLQRAVGNPEAVVDFPSLAYLATGLLAAGADSDRLECLLESPEGGWGLRFDDQQRPPRGPSRHPLQFTVWVHRRRCGTFWADAASRIALCSQQQVEVSRRCRWSPGSILLDGLRLDGKGWRLPDLPQMTSPMFNPLGCSVLGQRYLLDSNPPLAAPDPANSRPLLASPELPRSRTPSYRVLVFQCISSQDPGRPTVPVCGRGPVGCQAVITVPAGFSGPLGLIFVQGGVTLDPLRVNLNSGELSSWDGTGPGPRAVLSGDGLRTDLTGLSVVRDELLANRIAQARRHLGELCRAVAAPLTQGVTNLPGWGREWGGGNIGLGVLAGFGVGLATMIGLDGMSLVAPLLSTAAPIGAIGAGLWGGRKGFLTATRHYQHNAESVAQQLLVLAEAAERGLAGRNALL